MRPPHRRASSQHPDSGRNASESPHRHCDDCGLNAPLTRVAVLDVLYARERRLCRTCIEGRRRAGDIVDEIELIGDAA